MTVGAIIFDQLSNDATLGTLLGDSASTSGMSKIYPDIAPQKENAPFIVYSQISETPDHCAQGLSVRNVYVQVDTWAITPDANYNIAERVLTVLNNTSGTIATYNVDNILFVNQQDAVEDDLDPPLFGRQMEFKIRILL